MSLSAEIRAARERTLKAIRAEVYSPDGVTLALRAPVYCSRALNGPQKRHDWDRSTRTAP